MANYLYALKNNFRYITDAGVLTTEDLTTLKKEDLDTLAVSLEDEYNSSGKKSFIVKKSKKDKELKMKLDIVIDILEDKLDQEDKARRALDKKKENEELDALIYKREKEEKEKEYESMSLDELKKLRSERK